MKQTTIQKAIEYCPDEYVAMRNYLQFLLAEERQMVEDAYQDGKYDGINRFKQTLANDGPHYFIQTYQQ